MKITIETTPSSPTNSSNSHTDYQRRLHLVESLLRILQGTEMHLPHAKYSHETVCPHTPETSRCSFFDSFPDTSGLIHTLFDQTSTLKGAFVRLLCQIRDSVSVLPGSSDRVVELSQVESSLWSAPSLVCRVERHEDHIRIQFLDDTRPECVHSELILHLNFRNS